MSRKTLSVLAGLIGLALVAPQASAADVFAFVRPDDDAIRVWKPYVVEKNCEDGFYHCSVRMDYAPHERAMVVRPGSYWYQKPFKVYRYSDFKNSHAHAHAAAQPSRHVAWCSDRYRTYDPASDTFVGKGYKRHRCDSPFDGR